MKALNKKEKKHKSQQERTEIVDKVKNRFRDLGIDLDEFESFREFNIILKEYSQENIYSGYSGRYYIPEIKRYLEYILPLRKTSNDMVRLI